MSTPSCALGRVTVSVTKARRWDAGHGQKKRQVEGHDIVNRIAKVDGVFQNAM
jgi:hypothetical protein